MPIRLENPIRLETLPNGLVRAFDRASKSSALYHPSGAYHSGDLSPDCVGCADLPARVRRHSRYVPIGWDSVD